MDEFVFAGDDVSDIQVHAEVQDALRDGTPVVALESAVITAGLPKDPLNRPLPFDAPQWNTNEATNQQLAHWLPRIIREAGAVPASVGIIDGVLRIGLTDEELDRLALEPCGAKASMSDLSYILSTGKTAGATVSSTLFACGKTKRTPIRVMATGGICGGWTPRPGATCFLV